MRPHRLIGGLGLVATLGALANCASPPAPTAPAPGGQKPPAVAPPARNRVEADGPHLRNTRTETASPIDGAALATLYPAWAFKTEQPIVHAPLIDGTRAYVADGGGTVHALDRTTGRVIWQQTLGVGATGAELGGGRLYVTSADGQAVALDPASGQELWRAPASAVPGLAGTTAVRHFDGLLIVGLTDPRDGNGRVAALEAASGKPVWERALAADDQRGLRASGSFAVDGQLAMLYVTTSEAEGANTGGMSHSLVALDVRTGEPRWQRQVTASPGTAGFRAGPQLFEAGTRALVGAGQPSGTYTALDRRDGQVVWATPVAEPGSGGGIVAEAAFGDGKLFLWSSQAPAAGKPATEPMVTVAALDATTGKPVWSQRSVQPAGGVAGFLTDGVYFVGAPDGRVRGYAAADGRQLWFSRDHGPVGTAISAHGPLLAFGIGLRPGVTASPGPTGLVGYVLGASPMPGVPATPAASATAAASASPGASPGASPSATPTPSATPSGSASDDPDDDEDEDEDEDEPSPAPDDDEEDEDSEDDEDEDEDEEADDES